MHDFTYVMRTVCLSDVITVMCNIAGNSTVILFSLIRDFKITFVCFKFN